jgi:lipopolysaccharide export system protein LptC
MMVGPGLYSHVVAILKVGLPLIALGMLAALFLVQPDDDLGAELVFSPGDVASLGEGLRVSNPTFTGTTIGDDRFRFTAALVEPDAAPPQRVRITALGGAVALKDGPTIDVVAATGDLDLPTQRLDMAGNVRIDTSDGYRLTAPRVTLDLDAGSMIAGDQVKTTGPMGQIESGSLRVAPAAATGEARRFSFGDGVRLVYDPPETGQE